MIKRFIELVLFFSVLGVFSGCGKTNAKFELVNQSNENIVAGSVSLLDKTVNIGEISVDGRFKGIFVIETDSNYHVSIKFESGKKLEKDVGYVTRGFHFKNQIIVTSDDISIQRIEVKE